MNVQKYLQDSLYPLQRFTASLVAHSINNVKVRTFESSASRNKAIPTDRSPIQPDTSGHKQTNDGSTESVLEQDKKYIAVLSGCSVD